MTYQYFEKDAGPHFMVTCSCWVCRQHLDLFMKTWDECLWCNGHCCKWDILVVCWGEMMGVGDEEEKWCMMLVKLYHAENPQAYIIWHSLTVRWLRTVTISVWRGWACSFSTDVYHSIFAFISLSLCHRYPSHAMCLYNLLCNTHKPLWPLTHPACPCLPH